MSGRLHRGLQKQEGKKSRKKMQCHQLLRRKRDPEVEKMDQTTQQPPIVEDRQSSKKLFKLHFDLYDV
jgi:hypothetical protein